MIKSMETRNPNPLDKKSIRKAVLTQRDSLTPQEQQRGEVLITERLLGHQWYYASEVILAYAAFGSELSLDMLIEEALKAGKLVYLPRIIGEEMHFLRIASLKDLQPGYKGIREPEITAQKYEYTEEQAERTLILMPGVAFDVHRNRIGYGKGFYDRFLSDKPALQLRSIGVAHQCQVLEQVPSVEGDIRPYQLLSV